MPPYASGYRRSSYKKSSKGVKKATYKRPKGTRTGGRPVIHTYGPELKGVDVDISNADIPSTTNNNDSIAVLNLIQQGTGSWNRVGRKVGLYSVRLTGQAICLIGPNSGDLQLGTTMRMTLVWDAQPSGGAIPSFSDIFGVTDQSGNEDVALFDPPRYDNMDRFTVLRDKYLDFNPESTPLAAANGNRYVTYFDEYVKLGGRETVYSGSSVPMTAADVSSGSLLLIYRASANVTGDAECTVELGNARLRYND